MLLKTHLNFSMAAILYRYATELIVACHYPEVIIHVRRSPLENLGS